MEPCVSVLYMWCLRVVSVSNSSSTGGVCMAVCARVVGCEGHERLKTLFSSSLSPLSPLFLPPSLLPFLLSRNIKAL